ncbi:MAG: HAMP domain-containing sensor histidine kinase [Chloroflexota bacterium]
MIDLDTLVLVTTVVAGCELFVLVVLSRVVRVYPGPLVWALGLFLIVSGNVLNVLQLHGGRPPAFGVIALAVIAAGIATNEVGVARFLGLPERRGLLAAIIVIAVGLAVVGAAVTGSTSTYQVGASLLIGVLSARVAMLLLHPSTRPFRTAAIVVSGGFWLLSGLMVLRLVAVAAGAPITLDPAGPSLLVGATQLVALMATVVLTFGFVLLAHQRLAEELRAKERMLDELNGSLERRVTERTAQLEAANREMAAFTYSMSHDLRAPLRGINGFATLLVRRKADQLDEQGRGYLDRIVTTTEQMGVLIEALLDYARLGQAPVGHDPVALGPLILGVRDTFEGRVTQTGGSIEVAEMLHSVVGDPVLLSRIVTNLVDNALTYIRPASAALVRIDTSRVGGIVTLSVADNGVGIPADEQDHVFDVFTRLQSDDDHPGSGIGLSVVRKGARLMGGDVSLTSTVGQGSVFRVALPAA